MRAISSVTYRRLKGYRPFLSKWPMIYLKMTVQTQCLHTMQDFFLYTCIIDNKKIKLHMVRAQEKRSLSIYSHSVKSRDTITTCLLNING